MQSEIFVQATAIIDHSYLLLEDKTLNERQQEALEAILVAAEDFLHRYEAARSLPASEFFVNARHQTGRSLTPVHGYAELLLTDLLGRLNARQQAWVEDIRQRSEALYKAVMTETQEFATLGG